MHRSIGVLVKDGPAGASGARCAAAPRRTARSGRAIAGRRVERFEGQRRGGQPMPADPECTSAFVDKLAAESISRYACRGEPINV